METGDRIVVHSAFEDTWVSGFEIAAVVDGGFLVRRVSDGRLLPAPTSPNDVRREAERPWFSPHP